MSAIEKIQIKGFKAFPIEFSLELNGKHLLMYGENGSGKSSIYHALHCIFNSLRKPDRGKKYFDTSNSQNLINNTFKPENENDTPYVLVNWREGEKRPFISTITKEGCGHFLEEFKLAELDTCFINHQFLFSFFNFTNSKNANLFPIFQREILPYIFDDEFGLYVSMMYEQILSAASKLGNRSSSKALKEYIEIFNNRIDNIIYDINLRASDIYEKYFKSDEDLSLKITLEYPETNPNPDVYFDGLRMKWDYPLIVNSNGELVRAPNKKIIDPIITIKVEEGDVLIEKPHVYFNEAKLTAIALSIRFALLNMDNPPQGSFLALDDMLISLDMSNRAKVVEFLLSISDKYKIYIFTHDLSFFKYFASQIELSKVKVEEWKYLKLYMNPNTQSPCIIDEDWNYESKATRFFQISDYESCAVFLRKELEVQVSERLPFELKTNASGGFIDLQTLWDKLIAFYSKNGERISDEICRMFALSKLLILNPAAHYQRLSTPIFRSELINAFRLLWKIKQLKKIERKLLIPKKSIIEFHHPTKPYYCRFELETDLILEMGEHIVAIIPKCKNIYWEYNGIKYYNFDTGAEDLTNPLINSSPKVCDFIRKMPHEINIAEDVFISNCKIGGVQLDKFLCGLKFSQMIKA